MPIKPPKTESTSASMRNCMTICERRAPIARRIPISRVRSVTDASMMFMMPIPPTRSEMPAIAPRTIEKVRFVASACLRSWSGTLIA